MAVCKKFGSGGR